MSKNITSFVSTRGRGFSADLQLVKNYLMTTFPDMEFQYYLNKTATKISAINSKMEEARRTFCNETQNIICMDPSIPIKIPSASDGEVRLLLPAPFHYQFSFFLKQIDAKKPQKKQTFIRCTHIIPGSPFTANLLKSYYKWEENVTFIDNVPLPIAWDIAQEERKAEVRKLLEFYYPQAKGKKILTILLTGKRPQPIEEDEPDNPFHDFDLKGLLDSMGDDWFFLTNNWDLVDISHQLPYRYSPRFGYIKNKLPVNNMLYVSDMLITNSGRHAGIFSITQKPIYYLEHLPNSFGTYIERFYPSMFLKNIDEVLDIDLKNTTLSEDQKNFCHEFSYAPTENPFEAIKTIFQ